MADALSAFDRYDRLCDLHAHIEKDLTDDQKTQAAADREAARAEVARLVRDGRTLETANLAQLAERRANLLAPPADAPNAREIRDNWRTLPEETKKRLREKMATGERDSYLLALANDPLAEINPDAMFAVGVWQKRMGQVHADDLRATNGGELACRETLTGLAAVETMIR